MEKLLNRNGSLESNSWERDVEDWIGTQPNDLLSKMSLWTMTDMTVDNTGQHLTDHRHNHNTISMV